MAKMKGLGRGLDALLGGDEPAVVERAKSDQQAQLKIDQLQPGKYQPRTKMDDAALRELADSIKSQDRKSTRLNSSHTDISRMPSSA
mgnify:CR=1 FL=1